MSLNNKRERERMRRARKRGTRDDNRVEIFNKKKRQICSICYFIASRSLAHSLTIIFARIGPINTAICIQITQSWESTMSGVCVCACSHIYNKICYQTCDGWYSDGWHLGAQVDCKSNVCMCESIGGNSNGVSISHVCCWKQPENERMIDRCRAKR